MLNECNFKTIYRTDTDNISKDLIIPALNNSILYKRGAGFFSLNVLASLADGIIPFIKKGGLIQVITSVKLSESDQQIISHGEDIAKNTIEKLLLDEIKNAILSDQEILSLDLITNLIAAKILRIRIAYLPNGIYHEKVGIFKDTLGNYLCFIGSVNATYNGLYNNAESCSVCMSWSSESTFQDAMAEEKHFDVLWDNKNKKIRVYDIPEAIKLNLFALYKKSTSVDGAIIRQTLPAPHAKELYDYQKQALNEFKKNNFCHFFEMATGTGKTFTAIKCLEYLFKQKGFLSVLILVPQTDLQTQWAESLIDFSEDYRPFLFGGTANAAETSKNFDDFINQSFDYPGSLCIGIAVYDTFFQKLYDKVAKISATTLIIVDEAHNLTPENIKLLPKYEHRLGLSATPTRYAKEETDLILEYFTLGKVPSFKYTIDEAIKNGFLSHYKYYPIFVYLDEDEMKYFTKLSRQVSIQQTKLKENPKDTEAKQLINDLLIKRSSILKKAKNKIQKLEEMLGSEKYDFKNSVIYCGQGKDADTEATLIDTVTRLVSKLGKYSVSQFTSKSIDRHEILKQFESGFYDTLIAIKCFDEGVDVPKLDKIYIMASDAQLRQTIQRRGRVLRKCKETGKSMAYIYDFIVLPPADSSVHTSGTVKSLELRRINEYLRLADNKDEIHNEISDIFPNGNDILEEADELG